MSKKILIEKLEFSFENKEFIKLIISKKQNKKSELNKITIKPVEIKKGYFLSFLYNYKTQDITKNLDLNDSVKIIEELLANEFYNADLFTLNETIQLFGNKKGNYKIKTSEPTFKTVPKLNHDKLKKQRIKIKNNIYLFKLGITTEDGKIRKNMHDKLRQINKYLEIIEGLIKDKTFNNNFNIVDMGSGKGYLTFALYDFLKNSLKLSPSVTGVEFRNDLVTNCNNIAKITNFENLNFREGTIESYKTDKIDVLIALHACDTATDDAIYKGITAGSELIIVAPCCQKQIRKQLNVTNEMSAIVKHGILKEKQAVILTDGIRAMILEAYGYKTKVFEFISDEHTPKNVMIVGEKTKKKQNKEEIFEKINAIKHLFGIEFHYLEKLLTK